MKDVSLSRIGQLLIVTAALLAVGCAGVRIPPADMTPIPDTTGCGFLVFGEGSLWRVLAEVKPNDSGYYVQRIDPETSKVAARVRIPEPVPEEVESIVAGEGAVWVALSGYPPTIYKIDPMTSRVVATAPVGLRGFFRHGSVTLAAGEGAVWAVIPGENVLFRVDPKSYEVTSIPLSYEAGDVFAGAGSVWVRHTRKKWHVISRIDPRTYRLVATIKAPPSLTIDSGTYPRHPGRWMTVSAGAMWVLLGRPALLATRAVPTMVGRLDPQSNQFVATIDLQEWLTDIDAREGAIWIAAIDLARGLTITEYHSIIEIDSTTNTMKQKVPFGSAKGRHRHYFKALAVGAGAVWVCMPHLGIYRFPFGDGSSQRK